MSTVGEVSPPGKFTFLLRTGTVSRDKRKGRTSRLGKKKEGADRAGSVHDTKADAVEQAREQARRERVDVIIHGRNGKIQDSDSYGNDPFPPRDKKH